MNRPNLNDALCEAMFASPLQPSDALTGEAVAGAIGRTVRQFGAAGCADWVTQEFGAHPDAASRRMRWIRQLADDLCGCMFSPACEPAASAAGTDLLPMLEAA